MSIFYPLSTVLMAAITLGIGEAASLVPSGGSSLVLATNRFVVSGMHCNGCAAGLRSELKRTPGVIDATVTLTNKLAIIVHFKDRISEKQLIDVIEEIGFKAKPQKAR